MARRLRLRISASPLEFIDAIRVHAGDWRESLVPTELRQRGVFGVHVRIRGNRFTLRTKELYRPTVTMAVVRGKVESDSAGGSIVQARVGLAPNLWAGPIVLSLVAIAIRVSRGQVWEPAIVMLVAAGVALHYLALDEQISPDADEGARFLCARLETAIRAVDQSALPDPRA